MTVESTICEAILRESGLWKPVQQIRAALGREDDIDYLPNVFRAAAKDTSLSHKFNQRMATMKRDAEERESRRHLRYEEIDHKIRFDVVSIAEGLKLIEAYRKEFTERK